MEGGISLRASFLKGATAADGGGLACSASSALCAVHTSPSLPEPSCSESDSESVSGGTMPGSNSSSCAAGTHTRT